MDTQNKRPTNRPRRNAPGATAASSERRNRPRSAGAGKSSAAPARSTPRRRNANPARRPRRPAERPEIVYTQPGPFSRNRFLLRLATAAAVVLAVIFGMSVFLKVRTVTVSGANLYTPWQVRQASGIQDGDSLLTLNQPRLIGKITTALPYVQSARIGIKLPDTVNIEIVETQVTYSVQAEDNTWWLISAQGKVVEQTDALQAGEYTKISGLRLASPLAGQPAQEAAAAAPAATDPTDVTADTTGEPTTAASGSGSKRLETVLEILQAMEENGFVGGVTGVDVSDLQSVILWYGTQYEIRMGESTNLAYKIRCAHEAIDQMSQYQSGVLDVSFTLWDDKVVYTPYS